MQEHLYTAYPTKKAAMYMIEMIRKLAVLDALTLPKNDCELIM